MSDEPQPADPTSIAWPAWMLRYVATDDREAFDDLVWSVGGSPPYGGVSYAEASAVYALLEAFHGPGVADAERYAELARMLPADSEALLALELFRCNDLIASSEGDFGPELPAQGLALANRLGHAGAIAYFTTVLAQLDYKSGDITAAFVRQREAFLTLLKLSAADRAYSGRAATVAQNLVAFSALDGEVAAARSLVAMLSQSGLVEAMADHRRLLGAPPAFPDGLDALLAAAGARLEGGETLAALEWYGEAEARARAAGETAALCSLLGDKAVAFRRLGNLRRALETYGEAIELSRAAEDWLNLSRWSQNLAMLLIEREQLAAAEPHLKEGMAAALRSSLPRQIGLASLNYAVLLQRQRRYAEAVEVMARAGEADRADDELGELVRSNTAGIYQAWGRQLMEEGQIGAARDAMREAVSGWRRDEPEEQGQLAVALATLAELHERLGDPGAARAAATQAAALFEELGAHEAADRLKTYLAEQSSVARVRAAEADPGDSASAEEAVRAAVAQGDSEEESRARLALCNSLLAAGDARAFAELEAALALVRRVEDRGRELLLCLNFTLPLLERGEPRRAMTLANRAVELAGSAQVGRRIIALLNQGQVWAEGFDEPRRAMASYSAALAELERLEAADPAAARTTAEQTARLLARAAQVALELDLFDEAMALLARFDPDEAARIAALRAQRPALPDAPALDELRGLALPELDPVLAAWRGAAAASGDPAAEAALARMARLAATIGWADVQRRLDGLSALAATGTPAAATGGQAATEAAEVATGAPPATGASEAATGAPPAITGASAGGAAGLLRLVELRAAGLPAEVAHALARGLAAPADDLLCLVLYAAQDQAMGRSGVAFGLFELCAETVADARLAARCFELLAIFGQREAPDEALAWNRAGAERLAGGGDEPLRVKMLNEVAALLLRLGRPAEAYAAAEVARAAADACGRRVVAARATGNLAAALMNLGRWEEAVAVLEPLASAQAADADADGLAITRHNLAACYAVLGRVAPEAFDAASEDPDVLAALAAAHSARGDLGAAIETYERLLALVGEGGAHYDHEAPLRMSYARTLFSAGRGPAAQAQMRQAADLLERGGDRPRLREAYSWLTAATMAHPETAEHYGRRALELSRQLGDQAERAIDLAQLGQVMLVSRRYAEALPLFDEAVALSALPALALARADALTGLGRAEEALPIYERQLGAAGAEGETALHALIGMAEAQAQRGDWGEELRLLRRAHALVAGRQPTSGGVQAASRLGLALLRANRLEEAARAFDEGLAQLRAMGGGAEEHSLLNNLGYAQQALGDLAGAEATITLARSRSRADGDDRSELIALAHLGNLAASQGRTELALARYLEAADLARTIGDGAVEATCLDSAGSMLARRGAPERAIEYHRRAGERHGELGQWDDQVTDLLNLASAYLALGETGQAEGALAEARALAEGRSIGRALWTLALIEGQASAQRGAWAAARAAFRRAVVELEGVRRGLETPLQQRQWAADKARAYAIAAEAATLAGDGPAALELVECNKARFLQAVLLRRTLRPPDLDNTTWLAYERAADRLAELRARHRAAMATGDSRLEAELRAVEAEHARAFAVVRSGELAMPPFVFPDWAQLAAVLPPGQVAIALAVYDSGLGLVAAGRDAAGALWARARLERGFTAADLRALIGQGGERAATAEEEPGWAALAALAPEDPRRGALLQRVCVALGARVWPAIEALLPAGAEELVLMPGAGLNVLPLHAALLATGERADERFSIVYAPSLALLAKSAERWPPPAAPLLGQAMNPTEDAGLPFSMVEAAVLGRQLGHTGVPLAGREATVEGVLGLLERADIFHFCGHGFYDADDPFRSGLRCAATAEDGGTLTLSATLNRLAAIRARLVVLSACETGQVQPDDVTNDFLGLPGGLLVAGTGVVLATLWKVEDLATCLLLGRLFELWQGGMAVAEALRCAQAWLRDEVTVELVTEQLEAWMDELPALEPALSEAHGRWVARRERQGRPFKAEHYWAGFYLTGLAA